MTCMLFNFSTDEEHCLGKININTVYIQYYGSSFTCLYSNIIAMHGMIDTSVFMTVFVIQTEVLYV